MKLYDMKLPEGLTTAQIQQKIEKGEINQITYTMSKSTKEILCENICTLFNLLNVLIALCLIFAKAWSNLFFILIIFMNTLIGIIQELHARKLVEALSLVMTPSTHVIRNGKEIEIQAEELVLDDVMVLSSGDQICCDAHIIAGSCEVNESMLSGESDPVHKHQNDQLLSGSSIISGRCYARVFHVGEDNYAQQIANEVKQQRSAQSAFMKAMSKVTKFTCLFLIPLGILLLFEAFILRENHFQEGIISISAALLGMLPKGLVLLISISLAAGVSRLAKKKILVQDLYSLETLAHVDVLCLDKTGTITDGNLAIEDLFVLHANITNQTLDYISSYLYHSMDNNATYQALCDAFPKKNIYQPEKIYPFSSARKWSAAFFSGFGTLYIGAPDCLLSEIPEELTKYMQHGRRVLIISHKANCSLEKEPLSFGTPLYAIIMNDTLRLNIQTALSDIYAQDVQVKVISGDHAISVSAIAKEAGIHHWDQVIDMSTVGDSIDDVRAIVEQYTVFGRVSPKQKQALVQALQGHGHCVAMSGDGVNDMLAMKEADCSITVAQASDAVKQMSQIVLMDSNFSSLLDVVKEGRRVINNITRVAGVFFIKTLYSIALTLLCVVFNIPFPFIPIQITLIDAAIEAFPSFFSLLESDTSKVKERFLPSALKKALPNAFAIIFMIISIYLLYPSNQEQEMITFMYLSIAVISMQAVIRSCLPMNVLRFLLCSTMMVIFVVAVIFFPDVLHLSFPSGSIVLSVILGSVVVAGVVNMLCSTKLFSRFPRFHAVETAKDCR